MSGKGNPGPVTIDSATISARLAWLNDRRRVDALRGCACVLLLLHHVGDDVASYLHSSYPLLERINEFLTPVRMPLFSLLSGYVYALRPVERDGQGEFLVNKFRRLVVPFFLLTFLMIGLKAVAPSVSSPVGLSDIPHYLVYGYSHLWFLQAILLVFLLAALLDVLVANRRAVAVALLVVGVAGFLLRPVEPRQFSVDDALTLLPFFALGMILRRFQGVYGGMFAKLVGGMAVLTLGLGVAWSGVSGGGSAGAPAHGLLGLAFGLAALMLLFLSFPRVGVLSWMGRYSFTIFLFHSIFTAVAVRLGIEAPLPALWVGLLVSLTGPMLLEHVLRTRLRFLLFVIGQKNRQVAAGAGRDGRFGLVPEK